VQRSVDLWSGESGVVADLEHGLLEVVDGGRGAGVMVLQVGEGGGALASVAGSDRGVQTPDLSLVDDAPELAWVRTSARSVIVRAGVVTGMPRWRVTSSAGR
jgi:hypothetical protein